MVALVGTGADGDPYRANVGGSSALVGVGPNGRCLVKHIVADGTAPVATTVADLQDGAGDVDALALTAGQIAAIKTFLTNQGIDVSQFDADGPSDRRALLRFLLRRWLSWDVASFGEAMRGYDAG